MLIIGNPSNHRPAHFMVLCDGDLIDTRVDGVKAVRPGYAKHHRSIETVAELKATLRVGKHSDLGGYPLFFITADGMALSFDGVLDEFWQECRNVYEGTPGRIVAVDINYEDASLYCAITSAPIPSAYADDYEDMNEAVETTYSD